MRILLTTPGGINLCDMVDRYLRVGLSVIPARGKRPILRSWKPYQDRLPTDEEWAAWCRQAETWDALALVIGPATWARWPYLWVLDVEAPHRDQAEAWLGDILGRTAVAETLSGGLHVYFLADDAVRSTRFEWGDILGGGHIVILPPSGWDGKAYRWIRPLEGPASLLRLPPEGLNLPGYKAPTGRPADGHADGRPYMAVLERRRIPQGERNVRLTSLLGLLWQCTDLSPEAILRVAMHVNEHYFDPPLPSQEVQNTARSVMGNERVRRSLDPDVRYLLDGLLREADVGPARFFRTLGEIRRSAPSVEWVPFLGKPGWLMRGCVTLMAAAPGVGKSTLAHSVALDLVRQGRRVLYLSEDPEAIWAARPVLSNEADLERYLIAIHGVDALELSDELMARVETFQPDLIVIDTFRTWVPMEDENDAACVRAAAERVRTLASRTRAAVWVLHHTNDTTGKVAGSHVFRAFAEVVFILKPGRAPNIRFIEGVKRRHPDTPKGGVLAYAPDAGYRWLDGRREKRSEDEPIRTRILELIQAHGPVSEADVVREMGISRSEAKRLLDRLRAEGSIQVVRPGRRGRGHKTLYGVKNGHFRTGADLRGVDTQETAS